MQNLFHDLENLLHKIPELFSQDGSLLRNLVIEKGLKLDPDLLSLLLSHDRIKQHFFTQVGDVLVFDKEEFLQFVNNKEFLPDSYTAFKNQIGLSDDGGQTLINQKRDVELVWPYKDCVLEGGQKKEDNKRNEILWNVTIAPDDISRLLEPKVLTNWKYFSNGKLEPVKKINNCGNYLFLGNNLLALSSLLQTHSGKIKLIYIDPPFNIGSDDFCYNDSFRHSSWLTFMKNRLVIARDLLRDDGALFIHIDHHEIAYLNVMMNEIFGVENFIQLITIKSSSPAGFKTVNPGPIEVTEFLLFYTKTPLKKRLDKYYPNYRFAKN